jgi:hypothetical protein
MLKPYTELSYLTQDKDCTYACPVCDPRHLRFGGCFDQQ